MQEFLTEATLLQLIQRRAETQHSRVAVECGPESLTYAQLLESAAALANVPRREGVKRGDVVAIGMAPSCLSVASILAIWSLGAAYLFIDCDAPDDRIAFILDDANVTCVVADGAFARRVPPRCPVVQSHEHGASATLDAGATVLDLAYTVYTSGSTGRPKGVLIPHSAILNHSTAIARVTELTQADRVLQFTPLHFDAAGEEIFPALLVGATVVVHGELVATHEFAALIEQKRISVLSLPPAYLHQWVTDMKSRGQRVPSSVRLVLMGGEALLPETRVVWDSVGGQSIPWMNVYGPSEATITAAYCRIEPGSDVLARRTLPIGGPIDNVEIHLVDTEGRAVRGDATGEIFIGGKGLAWGYQKYPELTANAFRPDPFSGRPGARVYATGDLAYRRTDGRLEFVGRADTQTKIRGFRVELSEVESVLRRHPDVVDAAVIVRGEGALQALIGFAVTSSKIEANALRTHVASKLPEYMVPSVIHLIERMPLTANGKTDTRALSAMAAESVQTPSATTDPLSPTEEKLARIWREVLNTPVVRPQDDFFELGGNSLIAMQVLSRAGDELGVSLEILHIFDHPTVAQLARLIDEGQVPRVAASAATTDVDQLSDEQVDEMLRQLAGRGS